MAERKPMKPIPIGAARNIAETYRYDQVVIIGRRVGEGGGEHVTTYGRDKAHCSVAARIGDFLKHKVMGWPQERKVVTRHVYPPIPLRQFDWCAYYDGDEPNDEGHMMMGFGRTEQEAIDDLENEFSAVVP